MTILVENISLLYLYSRAKEKGEKNSWCYDGDKNSSFLL